MLAGLALIGALAFCGCKKPEATGGGDAVDSVPPEAKAMMEKNYQKGGAPGSGGQPGKMPSGK